MGGATVVPASIELSYATGVYGNLTVTHYPDKPAHTSAEKISSDLVAKEMGERQQKMFEQRSSPDAKLSLQVEGEGASYKADFSGYVANSTYAFSAGSCGRTDNALDEIGLIDAFDCSVYVEPIIDRQSGKIPLKENDYNLAKLIKWHIEQLKKAGINKAQNENKLSVKSKEEQSKINDKLWPLVEKLFKDSEDTIGWVDEFKNTSGSANVTNLDGALGQTIRASLKTTGGSFIGVIRSLCEQFQLLFVPDIDDSGKVTYRLVNKSKVFDNPEPLEVPIVQISMTAGSYASLFPVKYVAAVPINSQGDRQHMPYQSYVVYPESRVTEGSSSVKVMAPNWLTSINVNGKIDIKGEPKKETKLQGSAAKESVERQEMTEEEAKEANEAILKNWAKVIYQDIALADASVTLTTPLMKNISPGKCYTVKNMKGDQLFKGFCHTVTSRVVSHGSRQATLTAVFSHVEMGSFSLPSK